MAGVVNHHGSLSGDQGGWIDVAVQLLRSLLRLRTVNPPGREGIAARHLGRFAAEAGLRFELVHVAPGRAHAILELPGARPDLAPVVAVSHTDVVPAGRGWTTPPFGGVVADGNVWGRGAIDAKGVTAVWATVLAKAAATGALPRTLRLIAAAGEEHPTGALAKTLAARPELGRAHVAFGEGGGYMLRQDGQWFTAVGTAECGRACVPRHRHDPAGRAVSVPSRPPSHLRDLLAAMAEGRRDMADALPALMHAFPAGESAGGRGLAAWASAVNRVFPLGTEAIAGLVSARTAPGRSPCGPFAVAYTVPPEAIAPPGARWVWPASASRTDDPAFLAIRDALAAERLPEVGATRPLPMVTRGRTDLAWFRVRGVPSYGFLPLAPEDHPESVHGPDERISIAAIGRAIHLLGAIVRTVASQTAARAPDGAA